MRVIAPIEEVGRERRPGLFRPFLRGGARPRGFWQRGEAWGAFAGSVATVRVRDGVEDPFAAVRRRGSRLLEGLSGSGSGDARGVEPRLYGGFAFRAGSAEGRSGADPADGNAVVGSEDDDFPLARFELPELELRSDGERCWMALTAIVPGGASREEVRTAARERLAGARERLARGRSQTAGPAGAGPDRAGGASGAESGTADAASVSEIVTEERWRRSVAAILEAIRAGEARKVVPARGLEVTFRRPPDPLEIFLRLRDLYPGCFPFYLEPSPGAAFLCASPELVGSRRDDCFHTTAVAGTTRRGRDAEEDDRLARELLESVKNRSEHRIGVRDLRERLARIAGAPRVDAEPHILRLRGIQHLQTNLSVHLPERHHVLSMIRAVHPAAAVCGYPRTAALRILRERESVRRGWYAGPVGWFDDTGDGEFAPGLRSATVRGARVRLLAGAGIVEGSDPREEWEETSLKFRPIRDALGLRRARAEGDAGPAHVAGSSAARETVSVSDEPEAGRKP